MKSKKANILVAAYSVIVGSAISLHALQVNAAAPYPASDVLGQLTEGSPDFTTDKINNISTPNALGLSNPNSHAVDSTQNLLFVSDTNNNRVVIHNLDNSNDIIDRLPDYVLGQSTFTTDATGLSVSALDAPGALAVDETNSLLYVADSGNNRILIYDYSSLSNNMDAIHVLGQSDFTSNASSKTQSTFSALRYLKLNSSGTNLYVSDASRVLIFDVATIVNGENAVNVLGDADFVGTGTGNSVSSMSAPSGIALDESGERIYVADIVYDRILVFDSSTVTNGETAINVLGKDNYDLLASSPAPTATSLDEPRGLHYDSSTNYLYAASTRQYRVVVYDVASITNGEASVHVLGQNDFVSSGFEQSWRARLSFPYDISQAGDTLFVTSLHGYSVSLFDVSTLTDGEEAFDRVGQTDHLGNYPTSGTGANNPYTNADGLNNPYAVAVDSTNHRLFVGDSSNGRVLVYNLNNKNKLVDRTPDALLGQSDLNAYDGFGLTRNGFSEIQSLAYDSERDWLFVADAAAGRILVFDVATVTASENALYVIGQPDFTSSEEVCDQDTLAYPYDMTYDTDRQLLFALDWNCNNRVMVFDTAEITNGENAAYVIGQSDFESSETGTTASLFEFMYGIAFDPVNDWLFISDASNDRVLVFDTETISNGMDASYVLGAPDLVTVGDGNETQNSLSFPGRMAIDEDGRSLFVYDSHDRIMIFDIATLTNNEPATGLLLQDSFTAGTNPYGVSQTMVGGDGGMAYSDQTLYVADPYNERVMLFNFVELATPTLVNGNEGSAYSKQLSHTSSQGAVSYAVTSGSLPSGMSLSSTGLLSGTPTVQGSFNVDITVSDDNGVAGTFTDTRSYSLVIGGQDTDTDGVADSVEDAGPNAGDANGDGTKDSAQNNVSTNSNPVSNGYTTLVSSSGNIENFTILDEASLPTQNPVDFPLGLNSFSISGIAVGGTSSVTVHYDQEYDTGSWAYMKYDQTTDEYKDISDIVTYGTKNVGGNTITTATYSLTDGGDNDEDGIANGTIVDPAGPGFVLADSDTNPSAPDTGFPPKNDPVLEIAGLVVIFSLLLTHRQNSRDEVLTR